MKNRNVFAEPQSAEYKFNNQLSSGMPATQARRVSPVWSTIRILTLIDTINDKDTLAVLEGMVNGVHVQVGPSGVELHVHSRSLYSQIQMLLDAHELSFDPDVVIYIGSGAAMSVQERQLGA